MLKPKPIKVMGVVIKGYQNISKNEKLDFSSQGTEKELLYLSTFLITQPVSKAAAVNRETFRAGMDCFIDTSLI